MPKHIEKHERAQNCYIILFFVVVSYAIFIVVHKYICITHRFLHVSILFVYFFVAVAFPAALSILCLYSCANPRFILCIFLFRIVIIIMFFVCTPKCGEHHLHSDCEKNVIHFSVFFLCRCRRQHFSFIGGAEKNFYLWKLLTFREWIVEKLTPSAVNESDHGQLMSLIRRKRHEIIIICKQCLQSHWFAKLFSDLKDFSPSVSFCCSTIAWIASRPSFLHRVGIFRVSVYTVNTEYTRSHFFFAYLYVLVRLSTLYAYIWMVTSSPFRAQSIRLETCACMHEKKIIPQTTFFFHRLVQFFSTRYKKRKKK